MGCYHPSCLNSRVNEFTLKTEPSPSGIIDSSPREIETLQCDHFDKLSELSKKAALASCNIHEDITHDTHYQDSKSNASSGNSHLSDNSLCMEKFNYREHAEKFFFIINDMRNKPQKYLNKLTRFVKKYNPGKNSISLVDSEHHTVSLKTKVDPCKIIEYLEKAPSMGPILWSEKDFIATYEEVEFNKEEDIMFTVPRGVRIEADFILHSAEYSLFMILLQEKNNIQKLFSENLTEGIAICLNKKKTLIYLKEN
jgi:hypothetical protein